MCKIISNLVFYTQSTMGKVNVSVLSLVNY